MRIQSPLPLLLLIAAALAVASPAGAGRRRGVAPHESVGRALFASPQVDPIALSADFTRLFVAATTSNAVEVYDTVTNGLLASVRVGIDPVSVAVRPDGQELWVSNHVSDSVSVIDLTSGPTQYQIIATIQDVDSNGATLFDEPVGIAFTGDSKKAYVALSSRNDIAVIDTSACDNPCSPNEVDGRLHITNQDPRAIAVKGNRLYVAAFESGNQTEMSMCPGESPSSDGQCTMNEDDLTDFVVQSPNIPSATKNLIRDTDVPDRDVFVYDTGSDTLVDTLEGVGTLLYGIAVDDNDLLYVSQTEGNNDVNGIVQDLPGAPSGPEDDVNGDGVVNLTDMDNRMFFNQVAIYDCGGASCSPISGSPFEVDPALTPATALATPYGIRVTTGTGGASTAVVTAAASSRIFTLDDAGSVLSQLDVGAIPRGVALSSDGNGDPLNAYVLNTLDNSVTVVDVSDPTDLPGNNPSPVTFAVGNDGTPTSLRLGRIAFNDAFASDSGNFSCASCHPDGNTDQLLWRIGGRDCLGCTPGEDEARTTMPVRGLRNTLPLHWDGTLGDPFGGPNGTVGANGNEPATCTLGAVGDPFREHACFRDLVDASLSGVMCEQSAGCQVSAAQAGAGGSGLPGQLTDAERDNMALFLGNVSYPPPRSRPIDDVVTASALQGFSDFFVDQPGGGLSADLGDLVDVDTCADMDSGCHALPLGVDTNSSTLGGFDVPTMRGMTDRFVQFSLGLTVVEEVALFLNSSQTVDLFGLATINTPPADVPYDPAEGFEENAVFSTAFAIFEPVYDVFSIDMFQMFEEASTGFAGAVGRQITIDQGNATQQATIDAMDELESADFLGLVNLRANGVINGTERTLTYRAGTDTYRNGLFNWSPAQLRAAMDGPDDVMTLTAELRSGFGSMAEPLLSTASPFDGPFGNPNLPVFPGGALVTAIDVHEDAVMFVDGQRVTTTGFVCVGGSFTPYCDSQSMVIDFSPTPSNGLHLLQVQNPAGPLSNEFPICVGGLSFCD